MILKKKESPVELASSFYALSHHPKPYKTKVFNSIFDSFNVIDVYLHVRQKLDKKLLLNHHIIPHCSLKNNTMRFILIIFFLAFYNLSFGQYYMFGGYNFAAITMQGSNAIISGFNTRESHNIGAFANNFHGYRVGFGKYSKYTMVELGFGNLVASQKSVNPNQLKETAEVVINYMSAHASIGLKPFPKEYFTFGVGAHLGGQRIRYSFGGDYETPVNKYTIAAEFFIEYAIKIKFLLKKSQQDKYFYLLRIRPYYQIHQYLPVGNFETTLNQIPNVPEDSIEDDMSHFGFNVALVIPFMRDEDRDYLFAPPKKKKKAKDRKEKPKGRL